MLSLVFYIFAFFLTAFAVAQEHNERSPSICLLLPLSGPHKDLGEKVAKILSDGAETRRFDTANRDFAGVMQRAKESGCLVAIGGIGDIEAKALADAADTYGQWFLALGRVHVNKEKSNCVWVRSSREEILELLMDFAVRVAEVQSLVLIEKNEPYYKGVADIVASIAQRAGIRTVRFNLTKNEEGRIAREAAQWIGGDDLSKTAVFFALDCVTGRRVLGFMEFYGLLKNNGKGVVVLGAPSWNYEPDLTRSLDALEGAIIAVLSDGRFECEIEDAKSLANLILQNQALTQANSPPLSVAEEGIEFSGCSGKLVVKGGEVKGRGIRLLKVSGGHLESLGEGR
jgi:hypothetical protein